MFKDRVFNLTTEESVEGFLREYPTSVIFKAGTCHKTMQGFGYLQEQLEPREDLVVGLIRVVENRPASNLVTELTGLRHESPQVILFRDGKPVFEVNNWDITPDALTPVFSDLPEGEPAGQPDRAARSDLSPYLKVLAAYLEGDMDDSTFEQTYTYMFRDDASLRTREEVEVLNSIFGDVDQHINMHMIMAGRSDSSKVRGRAEEAYRKLQQLAA
ncbi:MAG TPA: monothiol bacilliredoxin BrxC family protein [Deinococcales bacterium]|nr:monothiol bacilliredoxin BrxC family protein [Deinococcales bacterium]